MTPEEPETGQRIVIDRDNIVANKFKLPWSNRELNKIYQKYASVWCDYPKPMFNGDTEWLLFREDL